jgi:LysM repeat protein
MSSQGGKRSPILTSGFGKGLWEGGWQGSWTALQGLASSMLGGDVGESVSDGEGRGLRGTRNGADTRRRREGSTTTKTSTAWGPSGLRNRGQSIGAGPTEAKDAAFKARKAARILENYGINGDLDVNGNYKRRTSLEDPDTPHRKEEDVLVYVHHVQPQDTLAGVVLKYNCQPAAFRKANRLWPNDSIQIRKVVLLPVDSCAIKGRPCDLPSNSHPVDALSPAHSASIYTNSDPWEQTSHDQPWTQPEAPYTDQPRPDENGQAWTHVRWVVMDTSTFAKPVEIARLPRKTLGYFPPRRRKSYGTASTSSVSTPRESFDFHLVPQNDPRGSASNERGRPGGSFDSKPNNESHLPSTTSSLTPRGDSTGEASPRPRWMKGPGGVGTLSKNVRKPGPAQDGLNSWASKHVPSLAIGYMPSSSATGSERAAFGINDDLMSVAEVFPNGSGTITPAGQAHEYGQGLGFEQAAAAIEGWVRKLAIKAPGTPKTVLGTKADSEVGDLIELLDSAGSDDGRGLEPITAISSKSIMGRVGSGKEEHVSILKGRMMGGKGKSD